MFNSALIFLLIITSAAAVGYVFIIYVMPILKRNQMASQEFPESWEKVLGDNFVNFKELTPPQKDQVRLIVKVFMAEKYFEPDDDLKWDEQILICAHIASVIYLEKHRFLRKLSTVIIGTKLNLGQGLLEVPSFESLKDIDYKKWY
jgi:hypothetical protein